MTKIVEKLGIELESVLKSCKSSLLSGNLLEAEKLLRAEMEKVYTALMVVVLNEVGASREFRTQLVGQYSGLGVADMRLRCTRLQLSNGHWVSYKSYYARKVGKKFEHHTRHLSHLYWSCQKGASLAYMSLLSAFSVVSISYEVGHQLLCLTGIKSNKSRLRELSKCFAERSLSKGDAILLSDAESLAGKRVVISFDGGRSRTRQDNGKCNKAGNACYDTPWREPKVMVVQVLDEQGKLVRKQRLPLYLATMQNTEKAMKRLAKLLKALHIDQAEHIQFIADGARSIWKQIMKVLRGLKLNFSKVTFTLDYYHAVGHLGDLVQLLASILPEQKQLDKVLEQYKQCLWKGKIDEIITDFKQRLRKEKIKLSKAMKTQLNYFKKHKHRMNYSLFKKRKLLCGSGLVESAVRRVVNLRFKGSSSFWKEDNLEKMLFLRCAFLAGRWNNLLKTNSL
ncbi:MAG: hypothetical protein AAF738_04850 [Bacteroidota bacterium]